MSNISKLACLFVSLLLASAVFAAKPKVTKETPASQPDAKEKPGEAPYVDSAAVKQRFNTITAEDMEMLRGKKILFASRSFGLNLKKGLRALAKQDKKYTLLKNYGDHYNVFKAGGDLSIIPADAFQKSNFVHFLASYYPHTKRVEEVDTLMRKKPHEFGKQVDAVIIYFHTANPKNFNQCAEKMDALQKDFPNAKIIYTTSGFMDKDKQAKANKSSFEYSELVRKRYKGKAPLYDLGRILSDDGRAGLGYCPEYSRDPAGVHPNLSTGETMMAKGFLLVLRDAFKMKNTPAAATKKTSTNKTPAKNAEAKLPPSHPDYKAVRAILDANNLKEKKVESVAVVKNGRIVELYLQEGGVKNLTKDIGQLTELRLLHLYGDRNLNEPLLESIASEIGKCVKLEELLLNQNNLTALPKEITALQKLKNLSIADNKLRDLPQPVIIWAKKFDPKGLKDQNP